MFKRSMNLFKMQIVTLQMAWTQFRKNISYSHHNCRASSHRPRGEVGAPRVTKGWVSSLGLQLAAGGRRTGSKLGSAKPDLFLSLPPLWEKFPQYVQQCGSATAQVGQEEMLRQSPPPAAQNGPQVHLVQCKLLNPTPIKHTLILVWEYSPRKQRCFGMFRELVLLRPCST